MAGEKNPKVYLKQFLEEGQNFQTAIDAAHKWSEENKDSITILSSIHTVVFDKEHYQKTREYRHVRAVAIRYTQK